MEPDFVINLGLQVPTLFIDGGVDGRAAADRCRFGRFHRGRKRILMDYTVLQQSTPAPATVAGTVGLVRLDCRGQWGNRLGQ